MCPAYCGTDFHSGFFSKALVRRYQEQPKHSSANTRLSQLLGGGGVRFSFFGAVADQLLSEFCLSNIEILRSAERSSVFILPRSPKGASDFIKRTNVNFKTV